MVQIGSTPCSSRCSPMKPTILFTGGRAPPARNTHSLAAGSCSPAAAPGSPSPKQRSASHPRWSCPEPHRCRSGHDQRGCEADSCFGEGEPGAAAGEHDPAASECVFRAGGARPPVTRIVGFIDEHREEHGVEPICTILSEAEVPIAVSSYYAARSRPVCARTVSDAVLDARIRQVHADNYAVYGYRKVWKVVNRQDPTHPVARCTVARRMRALGVQVGLVLIDRSHVRVAPGPGHLESRPAISVARSKLSHSTIQ